MKKTKLFMPLIGIAATAGMITPLVVSCGNKDKSEKVVPTGGLIINEGVFTGFDPELDLTQYSTVELPKDVQKIGKGAFEALRKEHNSNITEIVFNKELQSIDSAAFAGMQTVNKLDFSAVPADRVLGDKFMDDAFKGIVLPEKGEVGQGQIVPPKPEQNEWSDKILVQFFQKGKLPGEWLSPKYNIKGATWEVIQSEAINEWSNIFAPVDAKKEISDKNVVTEYFKLIKDNPSIFIDDFLYNYTHYQTPAHQGYQIPVDRESIRDIQVTKLDEGTNMANLSFTSQIYLEAYNKEKSDYKIELTATYVSAPIKFVADKGETNVHFVFDQATKDEDFCLILDGKYTEEGRTIPPFEHEEFKAESMMKLIKEFPILAAILWTEVEFGSHYFMQQLK